MSENKDISHQQMTDALRASLDISSRLRVKIEDLEDKCDDMAEQHEECIRFIDRVKGALAVFIFMLAGFVAIGWFFVQWVITKLSKIV